MVEGRNVQNAVVAKVRTQEKFSMPSVSFWLSSCSTPGIGVTTTVSGE